MEEFSRRELAQKLSSESNSLKTTSPPPQGSKSKLSNSELKKGVTSIRDFDQTSMTKLYQDDFLYDKNLLKNQGTYKLQSLLQRQATCTNLLYEDFLLPTSKKNTQRLSNLGEKRVS
jgi:hypothetical protein